MGVGPGRLDRTSPPEPHWQSRGGVQGLRSDSVRTGGGGTGGDGTHDSNGTKEGGTKKNSNPTRRTDPCELQWGPGGSG